MKKILSVAVVVALIIGIFIGFILGQNVEFTSSVVGVYKTDNWNGKTGTLVLYEDGTCLYPTGEEAKWTLNGDIVNIAFTRDAYEPAGGDGVENYEYKAKVIEEGIVLCGKFFEKMK